MDLSLACRDRLPLMTALLASGRIDRHRCEIVHAETATLSDDDARMADAMIAPCAPQLKYDALRRKARTVALMLDPDSDRQRKERATRRKARVEIFPEKSGNYAFAGRELPAGEALASKAHVNGIARDLKRRGVPGTLREIELMVYLDLTQGRDPYNRLPRDVSEGAADGTDRGAGHTGHLAEGTASPWNDDQPQGPRSGPPSPGESGGRAPFPASIHLLVTAETLLGWSNRPGEAGRDIIDPQTMRDLVQAASRHSRTRWDVTLVGADGTAIAYGRARGQHPWGPRPPGTGGTTGLVAGLGVAFTTIAKGTCDHGTHEDRYRPSVALQGLIRARNATCPSPVCDARAHHNDIDHTYPWPHGPTDQCNLGPPCRSDHRAKQAPGWELTQPEPGVFRWKTPNGRAYWTRPTRYAIEPLTVPGPRRPGRRWPRG